MNEQLVRLQKYMADNGIASRRKSEELIAAGKVKVNGRVASIGDKVTPGKDKVTVFGKRVAQKKHLYYVMLHKPRGFVTTMHDEMGRKCVADLVRDVPARVYPVGRLDRESEGLLLLTNDGEFANALTHPSKHIPKTYRVTVRPDITKEQLQAFEQGIVIDGRMTMPAEAHVLERHEGRTIVEVVIYEGRNRQIRKMCEALNLEVARLKRVKIGSLKLGMLKRGDHRFLTEEEVHALMVAAQLEKE